MNWLNLTAPQSTAWEPLVARMGLLTAVAEPVV